MSGCLQSYLSFLVFSSYFYIKVVRVMRYSYQHIGFVILKWCDNGAGVVRVG
ncbi:MAG: hypothetical protein ACFB2X_15105 [Rivularia sp. (in: cyanobacteria)]